ELPVAPASDPKTRPEAPTGGGEPLELEVELRFGLPLPLALGSADVDPWRIPEARMDALPAADRGAVPAVWDSMRSPSARRRPGLIGSLPLTPDLARRSPSPGGGLTSGSCSRPAPFVP